MTAPVIPVQPRAGIGFPLFVVTVMAGYLVALAWSMENTSFDVWGAVLLAPLLVALTVPLAVRVARREADPRLVRIILTALVLKLIGSVARYAVAFVLYEGVADAGFYDEAGREVASALRDGVFVADVGKVIGTGFIKIVTGVVYAVIGPTKLGGFLVFSWLGFWGLYLFYRAFRLAVPDGDPRRYALLVFFLPSLLFWPSSIGKEAWMTLNLGLIAYGVARLLSRRRGAFPLLALGALGTVMVRPHVTLLAFAALVVAYLVRRTGSSPVGVVTKGLGLVVLFASTLLVVTQVQSFFGVERLDAEGVDQALTMTERQTSQWGSEFEAARARSILHMPKALVSVLFRPFPFEAHNFQAVISSMEGTLLLFLFVRSRRRLLAVPRLIRSSPYVTFSCAFALLFVFAFSTFGNFGLIARERVQVFPAVLVLLALPPRVPRAARAHTSPFAVARATANLPVEAGRSPRRFG
jgi:hypothetical protein